MQEMLEPLKTESLKQVFISRFEQLILSGNLSRGQKLPSERELALQLGVSRPVVHEGLVELAAKGLVTMRPRVGTIINDYRQEGSPAILSSLINYRDGIIEPGLLDSMLDMRLLFQVEAARLAAGRRTRDQLNTLRKILEQEKETDPNDVDRVVKLDFHFHHMIAMASGNIVYPLLINSFKQVYANLASRFFSNGAMVPRVFYFHGKLLAAIEGKDEEAAVSIMKMMIEHGGKNLKAMIAKERRSS